MVGDHMGILGAVVLLLPFLLQSSALTPFVYQQMGYNLCSQKRGPIIRFVTGCLLADVA